MKDVEADDGVSGVQVPELPVRRVRYEFRIVPVRTAHQPLFVMTRWLK